LSELGGKILIIGLTGGIATGKSTVCKILKGLNVKIIDSDKIAHQVLTYNDVIDKIKDQFGEKILDQKGNINRKKLGSIVFEDDKKRKLLESITHPKIFTIIENKIEEYKDSEGKIIVLDAPLLFETSLDKKVDETWVVYTSKETQINRIIERDNLNKKEAMQRIDAQMDLDKKAEKADIVINNEGSIADLEKKITKLVEKRR